MANPRKFSEKIALHNQKQAEETAAFEQIMKEVIGATRVSKYNAFFALKALSINLCICYAFPTDFVYVFANTILSQH